MRGDGWVENGIGVRGVCRHGRARGICLRKCECDWDAVRFAGLLDFGALCVCPVGNGIGASELRCFGEMRLWCLLGM